MNRASAATAVLAARQTRIDADMTIFAEFIIVLS
jgi:hypothetical protein